MRGTPTACRIRLVPVGIIPAYAGNTECPIVPERRRWDHPRVCGEHQSPIPLIQPVTGSSPRMRGTRTDRTAGAGTAGIIPAYAGNTDDWHGNAYEARDHPRVCGEHIKYAVEGATSQGSSPRMRGTPTQTVEILFLSGIIPAYAGNTTIFCHTISSHRDHPRVCGEHEQGGADLVVIIGSSPRMRGTRHRRPDRRVQPGIIPAYAGNTSTGINHIIPIRDHPRVCGEHRQGPVRRRSEAGSSPRMRGTRYTQNVWQRPDGIIPAYAGNTLLPWQSWHGYGDHPRVCGEHIKSFAMFAVR